RSAAGSAEFQRLGVDGISLLRILHSETVAALYSGREFSRNQLWSEFAQRRGETAVLRKVLHLSGIQRANSLHGGGFVCFANALLIVRDGNRQQQRDQREDDQEFDERKSAAVTKSQCIVLHHLDGKRLPSVEGVRAPDGTITGNERGFGFQGPPKLVG